MANRFINRYLTFCRSLKKLEKSRYADLAHDYDGTFAAEKFQDIIKIYYPLFEEFSDLARKYYKEEEDWQ